MAISASGRGGDDWQLAYDVFLTRAGIEYATSLLKMLSILGMCEPKEPCFRQTN